LLAVEICRWCRPNIRGERERQRSLPIDINRHDIVTEQTPASLEQPHHQRALADSGRTRQQHHGPVYGRGTGVQPEKVWMRGGEVGRCPLSYEIQDVLERACQVSAG
jgi:hypothetical protein